MANDNNGIPNFDAFQDHQLHRRAKLRAQKGRKPKYDDRPVYEPRIVTCPVCKVTFDSNIEINKKE